MYRLDISPATIRGANFKLDHLPIMYRAQARQFLVDMGKLLVQTRPDDNFAFTIQEMKHYCQCFKTEDGKTAVLLFANRPCNPILTHILLKQIAHNYVENEDVPPDEIINQAVNDQYQLGDSLRFLPEVITAFRDSKVIPTIPHYSTLWDYLPPADFDVAVSKYYALPRALNLPPQSQPWYNRLWLLFTSRSRRPASMRDPLH
jgi:hypothetical protein